MAKYACGVSPTLCDDNVRSITTADKQMIKNKSRRHAYTPQLAVMPVHSVQCMVVQINNNVLLMVVVLASVLMPEEALTPIHLNGFHPQRLALVMRIIMAAMTTINKVTLTVAAAAAAAMCQI